MVLYFRTYFDDFYLTDIQIGTPYQNFTIVLDTGLSNLIVIDSSCTREECKGNPSATPIHTKNQFNASDSTTFAKTSQTFNIFYGSGNSHGYIATDVLNLAGLVYPKQGIAVATYVDDHAFGRQPIDGILGLAWPSLAKDGVAPPLFNLLDQLDQPIFTVWLDRHVKPAEAKLGGLITYGGLDNENCDGNVDYVISDTGTAWIGVPTSVLNGIIKQTGAWYDYSSRAYTVPCNGVYPDLMFTIGGKVYPVPSSEYVIDLEVGCGNCALTVFDMQGGGFGPSMILGDTWIRTYCNVHDVGQGRIGFAKARHSEI